MEQRDLKEQLARRAHKDRKVKPALTDLKERQVLWAKPEQPDLREQQVPRAHKEHKVILAQPGHKASGVKPARRDHKEQPDLREQRVPWARKARRVKPVRLDHKDPPDQ